MENIEGRNWKAWALIVDSNFLNKINTTIHLSYLVHQEVVEHLWWFGHHFYNRSEMQPTLITSFRLVFSYYKTFT